MIEAYELITLYVGDTEISARPVGWDREIYDGFGNDINGEAVKAVRFNASCPNCGNLIDFHLDDIFKNFKDQVSIACESCGVKSQTKSEVIELNRINPTEDLFLDPIKMGLISFEVDLELLNEWESTEGE